MTNAELIQKIRAEIEMLYDGEAPKHDQQCDFSDGYFTGISVISNFLDTLESEKPMVQEGLEEELDRFIASGKSVTVEDCGTYKVSYHDFKKVARHFAQWQKEQMLKEAVEGIVTTRSMAGNIVTAHVDYRYKDGQKVRVIIVKEDEK